MPYPDFTLEDLQNALAGRSSQGPLAGYPPSGALSGQFYGLPAAPQVTDPDVLARFGAPAAQVDPSSLGQANAVGPDPEEAIGQIFAGRPPPSLSPDMPDWLRTANSALLTGAQYGFPELGMVRAMPEAATAARSGTADLRDVYAARARQMELPPAQRIQPQPEDAVIDTNYAEGAPIAANELPDLAERYPRNPDPSASLPLGDRARVLVDRRDEIAKALADKIRSSGQLDSDTRYFYHSDGPIYRAARELGGLNHDEAMQWLKDYGDYMAATSPRTSTEPNTLNALSAMTKTAYGIPHREIIGPGSGGISERGYPMMTGPGGIHGQLLDAVTSGAGIDPLTNPKPATFGPNMAGNRSGVTADTHAIRGALMTLNELHPGSVPDGFIQAEALKAYKADPSKLTANMINDALASQMVGPKGARYKAQTEYPVFADIWHKVANDLNVDPADAQAMGWFGLGGDTGLASQPKTAVDLLNDRISVTSQGLGISPQEVARRMFRRQIPLMTVLGGVGLGGAIMAAPLSGQQQYQQ